MILKITVTEWSKPVIKVVTIPILRRTITADYLELVIEIKASQVKIDIKA